MNGIEELIRSLGPTAVPVAHGAWSLALSNGKPLDASLHVSNDWLVFESRVHARTSGRSFRNLLELNSALPPSTKFLFDPTRRSTWLASEHPLRKDMPLSAANLTSYLDGFREALHLVGSEPKKTETIQQDVEVPSGSFAELQRVCEESGWYCSERSASRFAVTLDVPGDFFQAFAEPGLGGALRFRVPLIDEPGHRVGRLAVASLLMTLCSRVRFVRAGVVRTEARDAFQLEATIAQSAQSGEVAAALEALSVACRIAGTEVRLVAQDRAIAQEYLKIRGFKKEKNK